MAGTNIDPGSQILAWVGLVIPLPDDYRPAKIEGDHNKGLVLLADDKRARLLVAWGTVTRSQFDAATFCKEKLLSLFDDKAGVSQTSLKRVDNNPVFSTMFWAHSKEEQKIRAVGYCPETSRVIDCLYHTGTARQDLVFTQGLLGTIKDQSVDRDYQWEVLGTSFKVPGGFRYLESTLNLGDQTIRFIAGKSEARGPVFVVRQLYPSELALNRQPLEEWLDDWATARGASYSPQTRREGFKFPVVREPLTLAGNQAISIQAKLRIPLRFTHWWMPKHSTFYGMHHLGVDRLLMMQASGPEDQLDAWAGTVAGSLRLSGAAGRS